MSAVIAYVGLTHLGLVYAAASAAKGFRVVAFDPDEPLVKGLASATLPVEEPGLEAAYRSKRERFVFSSDPATLGQADVVFISADVPTDDQGRSDLARTRKLIDLAKGSLKPGATLVILCQVPPGFTRSLGLPVYYQVETLVFGQALARAMEPERFIVGCADPAAELPAAYASFLQAFGCPILRMRYESAELTKIAINCFLVASVSATNTLAELCEKLSADWSEIAPALRLDRRIGPHAYLAPGLGIAGGNLERDLATVIRFAEQHGTDAGVVRAWVGNSQHRRNWAAGVLKKILEQNADAVVAVWGLTYKENTNSTKNSPSLATLAQFPGMRFRKHDPALDVKEEPLAVARGADVLMILTPWPQYRGIAPAQVAAAMRGRTVVDPYGVLDRKAARDAGLTVHALGRPADA